MKKILFISHDATRTGAPTLLLNLVKWIREEKQNDYIVSVMFIKGGPLISEFKNYAETYLLYKYSNKPKNISTFINNKLGARRNKNFISRKWDLIFSNTIVNGNVLENSRKISTVPIVSYIHELDYSINQFIKKGWVQGSLKHSNYFLCGSKLVQETLVEKYKVKESKTKVVHSFLEFKFNTKNKKVSNSIREELQIPKDALVVAMIGSFIWRKGFDFFIETAKKIKAENIYFLWVGADNKEEINKINYDLEKSNSTPKVIYIPSSPDYLKYFNLIDVFYLSSREDPYPLVMIDATSYGIPIICFENAGGTQEFIDSKTGAVIPYGDIDKVVDKIEFYNKNREELVINSDYIKSKSMENHNIAKNAPLIFNEIERLIKQ